MLAGLAPSVAAKGLKWTTAWSAGVSPAVSLNWGNYFIRDRVPAARLLASGRWARIRLRAQGSALVVQNAWIGDAGTASAFSGNQVRLFWSGAGGVTIPVDTELTSDPVIFGFSSSIDKVVHVDFNNNGIARFDGVVGGVQGFWAAGDDNGTLAPSGMTAGASPYVLSLIEVSE